ncbi:hypothetical protein Leryth_002414 [Lithospermum erythrorhizon]|nr:hypothetical protein Leryth_002414 [Lithospermum erythrorhizon]
METMEGSGGSSEQRSLDLEEKKILKVMVALDESDGSCYALQWSLDYLIKRHRMGHVEELTRLILVHAQPPIYPFVYYAAGPVGVYATPTVSEAMVKAQNENAKALLSRALSICKENMVKAETIIVKGDPKEIICQTAEDLHVDLLIMGSRGLSSLKRAFLGSVSDYCAHHAHCPILIVKPPKETKK